MTDSISSTYNISHMKYIRIFCIECRKDKKEIQFSIRQMRGPTKKSTPNRYKVTIDFIQGTPG